ncbi:hypothetical protein TIFTF001_014332 [Ficus carica]|uniref:Uncharacterized protein n=1 Tax=Ficus carica TaxID=3494 RepID=A0AA87ZZA4_FICCA|nr:hypothetical protein TIFTF001_014332 [Ficus carica]
MLRGLATPDRVSPRRKHPQRYSWWGSHQEVAQTGEDFASSSIMEFHPRVTTADEGGISRRRRSLPATCASLITKFVGANDDHDDDSDGDPKQRETQEERDPRG